jgi:hypothetical protein
MHALRDDQRLRDHAAAVADLLDLGVEEQMDESRRLGGAVPRQSP